MPAERSDLTLYDLSLEGVQIRDLLVENEGELTPELEARIDALMLAAPEKVEAAAMVVRSLEASAKACEAEVERLGMRARSFERNAQQLKDRIAVVLDCAFNGKIKTDRFTLWTQAAPDHVAFDVAEGHKIEEIERADPSLVRVKKELDKIELGRKFKAGEPLPVAIRFERTPGKRYARIK